MENNMQQDLGRRIRSLREDARMSQAELADALKVSRQAVSRWERGSSVPDAGIMSELCRVLGAKYETIFGAFERCEAAADVDGSAPLAAAAERSEDIGRAIAEMRDYIERDKEEKQRAECRRKAVAAWVVAMVVAAAVFVLFFLLCTTWHELFPPANGSVGTGAGMAVKPISELSAADQWTIVTMTAAWFACGAVASAVRVLIYNRKSTKRERKKGGRNI